MTTGAAKKAIAMIEFFQAVLDPDNRFLAYALAMGGLASIAFGIIGTFVTIKRISYLAGAISHSVFGGIGLALYLQVGQGIAWFDPILGAVLAAVIAALVVGLVSIHAKEREDTIIGTLWAVGMACGILFIDRTPGYFSLSSYLFGDILLISQKDLLFVIGLDLVIAGVVGLFFNQFFGVCFDAEFTLLRGINTTFFYLFLLVLTALTVVLLVRIVGIVLVIALLTIPPGHCRVLCQKAVADDAVIGAFMYSVHLDRPWHQLSAEPVIRPHHYRVVRDHLPGAAGTEPAGV